jgi:hypothetical protein
MNLNDAHSQPFKLLRYYSLMSFADFVVVAIALAWLSRESAVRDLVQIAENKNAALTQAFSNSVWSDFAALIDSESTLDVNELRRQVDATNLRDSVLAQAPGLSVVKLKLYDLDGTVVFSTDASQIGDQKSDNEGFLAASGGTVATELTHRDTFSAFKGNIADRDVISSYVPVRLAPPPDSIVGVFEVSDDVTPFLTEIAHTQRSLLAGVTVAFTILYTVLFLVVKHGDKIISGHATERQRAASNLRARVGVSAGRTLQRKRPA